MEFDKDNQTIESSEEQLSTSEQETSSESEDPILYPDNTTDIRNISIKQVDKDGYFGLGKYGEFEVYIMMKSSKETGYIAGYINATKLCDMANKRFTNWAANADAKKMINAFASASGIPDAQMMIKITTSSKSHIRIRGTYVHPDLIPHIASWASPEFAIKVSKIVNQYMISQAIEEKDKLLKKKQDKIDRMNIKMDKLLANNAEQNNRMDKMLLENTEQTNQIKKLLEENAGQSIQIKKLNKRAKRLIRTNDEINGKVDDLDGKLTIVADARVVSTGKSVDNNMLIIIKNNDDPEEYDDDEELHEYHCMRVLRSTYNNRIAQYKKKHPDAKILLEIDYSPNSINLFKRMKDQLKKKIEFYNCDFDLKKKYTEEMLIRDINKIHNERLNTNDV
jgi:KilA-N domain/Protein of unknown function (DUF3627)